ncbi:MAG: MlaD family protein [Pseudomonadota bacterium]
MIDDTLQSNEPEEIPLKDRGGWASGLSFVWLVPVFAILIALGVAWRNWADRGPVIEIVFDQAAGVRPRETELRYRDIPVGIVETVKFSPNLKEVIVGIELDRDVAPFVDADASFWIVRPQVTTQGVSGLDTVLSGVYIEGVWDGEPGEVPTRFEGQPDAPLLRVGETGITITLRSENALPSAETPILYRGVTVGRVGLTDVADDGASVFANAVILDPYSALLSTSSRFWDASGFTFSLDAQGASLDFSSLGSLISGGITFETLASDGTPVSEGAEFILYPDEEIAREDFFVEDESGSVNVIMIFDQNLAGLQVGAQVWLGGLRVGQVVSLSGIVDQEKFGDSKVRLLTTLRLNPGRLGIETGGDQEIFFDYLSQRVSEGLRGRLTNSSLLTSGLMIELVEVPDAVPASLDRMSGPYPQVPTALANVTNITTTAQGILARLGALPVEELMQETIAVLASARQVVTSDSIQAAPDTLLATLNSIRQVAESAEVEALPALIGALATSLTSASDDLGTILVNVRDEDVVAAVSGLMKKFDETAATLPGLAGRAEAVLAKTENLPLEELSEQVISLLADADAILKDEDVKAIPADLRASLLVLRGIMESDYVAVLPERVEGIASGLQETTDRMNAILADLQRAQVIAAMSDLLATLNSTAEWMPGIAEQASAVLSDAEKLSLDELAKEAGALLQSIRAVLDQESTRHLPDALAGALNALRTTLDDLRDGGLLDNVNATMASARQAAETISEASRRLPALAERLDAMAVRAGSTLADYDRNSNFGRELSAALREIEAAADAIEKLARQIQRDPGSLLTGRRR